MQGTRDRHGRLARRPAPRRNAARPWKALGSAWLVLVALGASSLALADSLTAWRPWVRTPLMTPRDPLAFLEQLEPIIPRSVVPLTRQDAIAQVLVRQSRTMGEVDALRTATVMCAEAARLGYDPLLFLAVIQVESDFNHLAVSPKGAEGLMQLMPATAEWVAKRHDLDWADRQSFDPELNVRLGIEYLSQLHRQFKRMDLALTAYNRGPRATRAILKRYGKLPESVRDFYSTPVLRRFERLVSQYGQLPLA